MSRLVRYLSLVTVLLTPALARAGGPPSMTLAAAGASQPGVMRLVVTQCGTPVAARPEVRAEALVSGKKSAAAPELRAEGAGVYTLTRPFAGSGAWLLVASISHHGHCTLVARVAADGSVASRILDRRPTDAEIDAAVRGELPQS